MYVGRPALGDENEYWAMPELELSNNRQNTSATRTEIRNRCSRLASRFIGVLASQVLTAPRCSSPKTIIVHNASVMPVRVLSRRIKGAFCGFDREHRLYRWSCRGGLRSYHGGSFLA